MKNKLVSPTTKSLFPIVDKVIDDKFAERVNDLEIYQLDNGLRVFQMHDERDRSFYIQALVNAGAIHQDVDLRGVPHFVEHMAFKGSKNIGDKQQLDEFAQDYNLNYNAYTSNLNQSFHAVADAEPETAEAAARFVSEVLFNPLVPENEVELERGVIIAERKMYNSDPDSVVSEIHDQYFYGVKHPLGGGGILGTEQDLHNITHQKIIDFREKLFHPKNMVLIVSSGLPSEQMRALIEEYFNVESGQKSWDTNPILNQARKTHPTDLQVEKDFENVYLSSSYYLPGGTEYEFPNLNSFGLAILGYVLRKRIYQDLRDNQGLAYSVGGNIYDSYHGQLLMVHGEFPPEKFEQAKSQLVDYPRQLIENPVNKQEFKRAMRNLRSLRWANNAKAVVGKVAYRYFRYGQLISPEYKLDYYDKIDLDFVNNLAKKVLSEAEPEVISVGPVSE